MLTGKSISTAWCMLPGDMAMPIPSSWNALQFLSPMVLYWSGLLVCNRSADACSSGRPSTMWGIIML